MSAVNYPQFGYRRWKSPVANVAALPSVGNVQGDARVTLDTSSVYVWNGSSWVASAGTAITQLTGDVTAGPGPGSVAAAVATVGGSTAANVHAAEVLANAATSTNTNGAIVMRDGSGNFAASTITASGLDSVASGTFSIGGTNASTINIGRSGATINFVGSTINETVTNLNVTNKNIELNTGGAAASGSSVGIDVNENSVVTGYVRTSGDRNSWLFKAPNTAGIVTVTPGASGITLSQSLSTSDSPTFAGVTITGASGIGHWTAGVFSASSIVNADISSSAAIAHSKLAALTISKALVSDGSGIVTTSAATSTELGYVSGVTSAIQTQINSKQSTITTGTTAQYFKGDLSLGTFATDVTSAMSGTSPSFSSLAVTGTAAITLNGTSSSAGFTFRGTQNTLRRDANTNTAFFGILESDNTTFLGGIGVARHLGTGMPGTSTADGFSVWGTNGIGFSGNNSSAHGQLTTAGLWDLSSGTGINLPKNVIFKETLDSTSTGTLTKYAPATSMTNFTASTTLTLNSVDATSATDGQVLYFVNKTGNAMTVKYDGDATNAASQIRTKTAADVSVASFSAFQLIYAQNRWLLMY